MFNYVPNISMRSLVFAGAILLACYGAVQAITDTAQSSISMTEGDCSATNIPCFDALHGVTHLINCTCEFISEAAAQIAVTTTDLCRGVESVAKSAFQEQCAHTIPEPITSMSGLFGTNIQQKVALDAKRMQTCAKTLHYVFETAATLWNCTTSGNELNAEPSMSTSFKIKP